MYICVFKGSPIEKSGIKKGDIICSMNGVKVDNFGLFEKEWFNEKMKMSDLLRQVKNNEEITIELGEIKTNKEKFKYVDFDLVINKKYELYEKTY